MSSSFSKPHVIQRCINRNKINLIQVDKTQLYINLYSTFKLNSNIKVLENDETKESPTIINENIVYNIDPEGILFGNTPCGENNYTKLIEINKKL